MDRTFVLLGSLSGALAVVAGAFGAHGLRDRVAPDLLAVFETAARYQMYHALALVLVGLIAPRFPAALGAGWAFVVGTILFSGSLYLLVLTGQRWLGAVTPVGGVAFIVGWVLLARTAWLLTIP
jgi:uncharacterized membrane protein YgdD (TMEM256/DUF423 family)